jgi:hypothetical protein
MHHHHVSLTIFGRRFSVGLYWPRRPWLGWGFRLPGVTRYTNSAAMQFCAGPLRVVTLAHR